MLWAFRTRVSVTTTSSPFPSGCSAPWTHENGDATRTRGLPNHRRADRSRLAAGSEAGCGDRLRRLVRRLGFRRKGFSPRYLKIAGRWRDPARWALLAEEWRGRSSQTAPRAGARNATP